MGTSRSCSSTHPVAGTTCRWWGAGPFHCNSVGGGVPLSRPVAANAGLAAASGELLVFLDEDDLLDPGDLAGLV